MTGLQADGIESYSHEKLLAWVAEASDDPCPHILIVSIPRRSIRQSFLHRSARDARSLAMAFQCFDPDLVEFEVHRPASPEEIARDRIKRKLLFEESL